MTAKIEIPFKESSFDQIVKNATGVAFKNGMLVNTTTRHEAYKEYDAELLGIAKQNLVGINDLISRGLTKALSSVGTKISYYERYSDVIASDVTMDGQTSTNDDQVKYDEVGVPVPVYHQRWSINFRQKAALSVGNDIDTTYDQQVYYNITDLQASGLFNGHNNIVVSGQRIYGYTTHPDRNTYTISTTWTSATGKAIVQDVINMRQKIYDDNYRGVPIIVYIPNNYEPLLDVDYSDTKGDRKIREHILALSDIVDVKVSKHLASNNVVLVAMDKRVVDLAIAQPLSNIMLNTNPLFDESLTFGVQAPRIKSTYDGQSGVCHGSV